MKFFVLGCNGMAGHLISMYLSEQGHDVIGFARTSSRYIKSITGDVKNIDLISDIVKKYNFDVIINCIGILNQFAENQKEQAVFLNAYLPHFLADVTSDLSTYVIHMSTDCVFSGKTGGYTENSFRDGESFYDRSKALGELEDKKNLTLRNSIVGPDIKANGIGLLNWFLQQEGSVNGYINAIWTGQTTLQLAKTIEIAAKEHVTGLYNMVPEKNISKYDLLQLFNQYFKKGKTKIFPVENTRVDKSLIRTCFDFDYIIPDYEKMVCELAEWTLNHKDMYPHYHL